MLRSIFVLVLGVVGIYFALQTPFYALLFYLAYAYFRPEQWLWTNIIPPNFSFVLGAYVVLATMLSGQRFILNRRIILMLVFLFHSLISVFVSGYFTQMFQHWLSFLNCIVIIYCMFILVTDFEKFRLVLLIITIFLGIESAKQGWFYLITSPDFGANPNSIPFLGDNNNVAVGMLMLVPVIALLAQTTQHRRTRFCFWFLLIGVLFRALTTYSRGGFLTCIAVGGAYWLRSRRKLRVLLSLIIIIAIALLALPAKYWERMDTISTNEEEQDSSMRGRLHFWRVAIIMANANPLLGVGPACYNLAYDEYDFLQGKYGKNRSVHSSFFGVLAELGYTGFFLYSLIIFSALRSCRRVRKLAAKHPQLLSLSQSATALETSLVAFIVGGSFLPFQYVEMLWHYFGFTIVLEELATRYAFTSESTVGVLQDVTTIRTDVSSNT